MNRTEKKGVLETAHLSHVNFIPKGSGTASYAARFNSRHATSRLTSLALKLLGIPERSSLSSILSGGLSWCLHGNSTLSVEQNRGWAGCVAWLGSTNNREAIRLLPTYCRGNDDDARRKVNISSFKMLRGLT